MKVNEKSSPTCQILVQVLAVAEAPGPFREQRDLLGCVAALCMGNDFAPASPIPHPAELTLAPRQAGARRDKEDEWVWREC